MVHTGLRISTSEIPLFQWIFASYCASLMCCGAGKKGIGDADLQTENQTKKEQKLPHTTPNENYYA